VDVFFWNTVYIKYFKQERWLSFSWLYTVQLRVIFCGEPRNSTKCHMEFMHTSVDCLLLNMWFWCTLYLAIQMILTVARSNVLGTCWVVAGGRGDRAAQWDKCRERIVTTRGGAVTGDVADTDQNVITIVICHRHILPPSGHRHTLSPSGYRHTLPPSGNDKVSIVM